MQKSGGTDHCVQLLLGILVSSFLYASHTDITLLNEWLWIQRHYILAASALCRQTLSLQFVSPFVVCTIFLKFYLVNCHKLLFSSTFFKPNEKGDFWERKLMAFGAISFSPSNPHSCTIKCLEIDAVDNMFASDTFRARKCDIALERKRKT
jgi:hypothetical protein